MMMVMITSGGHGVTMITLPLMIILSFTTFSCSGLSCVECHVKAKTDDPCVTGPFDAYQRACCPLMTNAYCGFQFLVDPTDDTVDEVQRGCSSLPQGKDGNPGCYEVKEKDGDQMGRQLCMCFEDNCNTANPLKPDEIKAIARGAKADGTKSGASSPFIIIEYGTVIVAAFFLALHAFRFV